MRRLPLAALLAVSVACPALAQSLSPFTTFNQSPIHQLHGLPSLGESRVLAAGRSRYGFQVDLSSNYTLSHNADESVILDGETLRSVFSFQHGMGDDVELGIEIPTVDHNGGSLDGFIEDWHDFFHLPQGGRDSVPRDQLNYRYVRDGREELSLTKAAAGSGDVRLMAAWQWREDVALRAQLKLANGDSDHLLGSGGVDLAIWASGRRRDNWFDHTGAWFGGAGVLLMDDGDVLPEQQRRAAVFGNLGAAIRVSPRLALKLQLDGHSALYKDTELTPIAANAVQLIIGGDVYFSGRTRLELGVVEDLTVKASPDVVFHMALTVTP